MRWIWLPLILLTAVQAQPPSPPGFTPVLGPKQKELKESWGTPMIKVSYSPGIPIPMTGFAITNLSVANNQVSLSWINGVPPFQVEGEPSLLGPWNLEMPPTTARSRSFPQDFNHFFRVFGNIVMPLEATRTNNLTRLTWKAPDTAMSDSLQQFTLKRSTDNGATFPTTVAVVQPGQPYSVDDTTAIPPGGSLTWELLEQTLNGVVVPYSKPVASNAAPGTAAWTHIWGGPRVVQPGGNATGLDDCTAIAADSSGNFFITGQTDDGEFGNGLGKINQGFTAGVGSVFLIKYSPQNAFIWGKAFGTAVGSSVNCSGYGLGIAVRNGIVAIVGQVSGGGHMDFSGPENIPAGEPTPIAGVLGSDFFVSVYIDNGTSGSFKWCRRLGVSGGPDSAAYSVSINSSGDVIVVGKAAGSINYGDATRTGHMFVMKLRASDGVTLWSKVFGSSNNNPEAAKSVALDSSDNIYVTGQFGGTAISPSDFGEGHTLSIHSPGSMMVFLAKFDTNGLCQWANRYGGDGPDIGYSVVVDSRTNDVIICGAFANGSGDFGGANPLSGSTFVAKYTSGGAYKWAQGVSIGLGVSVGFQAVTVDKTGNITSAGSASGGATVVVPGLNPITTISGSPSALVVKWTADGNAGNGVGIWIKNWGDVALTGPYPNSPINPRACAVGPDFAPVVVGQFPSSSRDGTSTYSMTIDGKQFTSNGFPDGLLDVFAVKLLP